MTEVRGSSRPVRSDRVWSERGPGRGVAEIQGPRGDRLAGNLLDYERDRLGWLMQSRREFGPLVRMDKTTTVVHDPALVREILMNRTGSFAIRHNLLQERIPDAELGGWVDVRRLLNPHLRLRAVVASAPMVAQATREALETSAGQRVDAMALFEGLSARVTATQFFGADHGELPTLAADLLDALGAVIGNPFALPAWAPTRSRRRINTAMSRMRTTVHQLLDQRARHPEVYDDLATSIMLDPSLTNAQDQREGLQGDGVQAATGRIARALVGALLAGHRVPAAAMGWLHLMLLEHPGAAAALRPEAATMAALIEQGAAITPDSFPATARFIAETLRLFPPTWLVSRSLLASQEVAGYTLPAGHTVLLSPYVVHRDPDAFTDPETFNPDRWRHTSTRTNISNAASVYFPYGVGPRACPGRDLAALTLTVVLLTSVHAFNVERSPRPVVADPRTTLLPAGLELSLAPRRS